MTIPRRSADATSQAAPVTALDESNFDRAISAVRPTLVAFGGPGCAPCEALRPILRELAGEHAGRLQIGTVRLDVAPGFVGRFTLKAMPTLIVFAAGVEQKRITGVTGKSQLVRELAELLP